jgi:hypothetical protein
MVEKKTVQYGTIYVHVQIWCRRITIVCFAGSRIGYGMTHSKDANCSSGTWSWKQIEQRVKSGVHWATTWRLHTFGTHRDVPVFCSRPHTVYKGWLNYNGNIFWRRHKKRQTEEPRPKVCAVGRSASLARSALVIYRSLTNVRTDIGISGSMVPMGLLVICKFQKLTEVERRVMAPQNNGQILAQIMVGPSSSTRTVSYCTYPTLLFDYLLFRYRKTEMP